MKPWWERFPGRLEDEIRELEEAGYECKRDEEAFKAGFGALRVSTCLKDWGEIRITIRFPYFYPYFQFLAFADDMDLSHHQNPFTKNLCLVGRDPERWYPSYTVAKVLKEMLPRVLEAGSTNDLERTAVLEQDQAEPFSDYYRYLPGSSVIWDGEWLIPPEVTQGSLKIGLHPDRFDQDSIQIPRNWAMISINDERGRDLGKADPRLRDLYSKEVLQGIWIREKEPVKAEDGITLFNMLQEQRPFVRSHFDSRIRMNRPCFIGIVFPEEISRRRTSDGWVFLYVKAQKEKR